MKKINFLLAALLITAFSFSQENSNDTTKLRLGNKNIIIVDNDLEDLDDIDEIDEDSICYDRTKNFESYWASFTFGINSYFAADYETNLPLESSFMDLNVGKSWEIGLNIWDFDLSIIKNRIGLNSGIGFKFNNYRFNQNTILTPSYLSTSDVLSYSMDTINEFKKNKLSVYSIQMPLMLSIHIPMKKDVFIISAGGYAGIRYHSFTKQKIKTDNSVIKTKHNDDFNISPFFYGMEARIGTDDFMIYAHVDMTSMFDENKGPELYPFSIGAVIPF